MRFEPPGQLGKYPLVREIGSGATSCVYLARDPFSGRDVAIKVFLFERGADPQTERMKHKAFVAEASLAGKLNHPHIVEIYDAVVEPDHSYLVMEYVPGTTLEAHSGVSTLLPLHKVVEIIFKSIRALEYAFQHGIIHRDIKPGNILLSDEGETKVSDFGASFQQRPGQHDHADHRRRLARLHVARAGAHGAAQPADRHLLARRHHVSPAHRAAAVLRHHAGGAWSTPSSTRRRRRRPRCAPTCRRSSTASCSGRSPRTRPKRYASWLEFGKELIAGLHGAAARRATRVTDSEKFSELRNMAFFEDFGDVALWEVVRIGTWTTLAAGTVIIREGDEGDSFYLLVKGEVAVTLEAQAARQDPARRLLRRDGLLRPARVAAHHHRDRAQRGHRHRDPRLGAARRHRLLPERASTRR